MSKGEIVDHKWIRDPFKRYDRWWQMFRLLIRVMRKDGSLSPWYQATDEKGRPITYVPCKPRRGTI